MTITQAEELDGLQTIGRIVANTLREMAAAMEPGMTTRALDRIGRALPERAVSGKDDWTPYAAPRGLAVQYEHRVVATERGVVVVTLPV